MIKNTKGYHFTGFTNENWASCYDSSYGSGNYNVNDPYAFLVSLEFKEKYPVSDGNNALDDFSYNDPSFGSGSDLCISNSCFSSNSSFDFPNYYCETRMRALPGGENSFKVNELEVYKIGIIAKKENLNLDEKCN